MGLGCTTQLWGQSPCFSCETCAEAGETIQLVPRICLFPRENEVTLEAHCTKFTPVTMAKFLDILKELGTHFKMRYCKLKSEERPASYRILKKVHKQKNPAELNTKCEPGPFGQTSVLAPGETQKVYNIVYSQAVTHPSTNTTQCCLTSVIGRELVLST